MSESIKPGHDLHPALLLVQNWWELPVGTYNGVVYRAVKDNDHLVFVPIQKKPEKSTFGRPDAHHRGYYPPEGIRGPEGEIT